MSIWSSITPVEVAPVDRDNYTGEPLQDDAWFVDVATAKSWNSCTRFILQRGDLHVELMLTQQETRDLARLLALAAAETSTTATE